MIPVMPDLCKEYFEVSDAERGHIPSAAFDDQERTKLCLSHIELVHVTPTINQFRFLKVCHISHNHLRELPEEFYDLKCLEELDASKNCFNEISPSISKLARLSLLNFSSNYIVNFLNEVCSLPQLKLLELNANSIFDIPEKVSQLTQLVRLYLTNNYLVYIPGEIKELHSLKVLHLDDNLIVAIHPQIGCLINLEELNLAKNLIDELPPEIGRLRKLRLLNIQVNRISTLPITMMQWSKSTNVKMDMMTMRNQRECERSGTEIHSLYELAAAVVYPNRKELPYYVPKEILEYLYFGSPRFSCPNCWRSGRKVDLHFGKPWKIIRRLSKKFNHRSRILPFVINLCYACFLKKIPSPAFVSLDEE